MSEMLKWDVYGERERGSKCGKVLTVILDEEYLGIQLFSRFKSFQNKMLGKIVMNI